MPVFREKPPRGPRSRAGGSCSRSICGALSTVCRPSCPTCAGVAWVSMSGRKVCTLLITPYRVTLSWRKLLEFNLWGVINSVQTFLPDMLTQATPALVINTGSKQGITNPPGNPAYNVTKAGVKALTESLAHELRALPNGRISAHLLVPGFTFTGITGVAQKPAGAWTGEQVVDFMLDSVARGDFYILCP